MTPTQNGVAVPARAATPDGAEPVPVSGIAGIANASELLPCPFCGCREHLFIAPDEIGSGGQWVSPIHAGCSQTTGCGVSVWEEYAEDAIAKWNTRPRADRFYIDCEFDGHAGDLLSIAVVCEDGRSLHVDAIDTTATDPWVIANVVPLLGEHEADQDISTFRDNIGAVLRRFIAVREPVIIADSPVDIGRFCRALSTDSDGGWASTDYASMTFEVHNVDCYPTDLPGAVQHNAWWDAMALRHKLAQGTSGSAQDRNGLDPKGAGPVAESDAP